MRLPSARERRAAWQVARTELRSLMRDKRAIFSAFVLPIVLYPFLFLGQEQLESLSKEGLAEREVTVYFADDAAPDDFGPRLRDALEERAPIVVLDADRESLARIDEQVHLGTDESAVRERELFEDSMGSDAQLLIHTLPHTDVPGRALVRVHYDGADDLTGEALRRLREAVDELDAAAREQRIATLLGPDPAAGLALESRDLASDAERSGMTLGRFLPLLAVIVLLSGGATAALAAFAGEREAGTLETLLVQPVRAEVFVWGKFTAVLIVSLVTLVCNVASVFGSVAFGLGELPGSDGAGGFGADPVALLLSAVVFLPAVLMLCATLCWISGRAKSFREGQHLLLPLMLVALAPTALSTQRDLVLEPGVAWIPMAGQALSFRDALTGSLRFGPAMIAFVTGCVWAALALARLGRAFDAERLFGSPDAEREAAARRLQSRRALAWGWGGALVVFLANGLVAGWDPLRGAAVVLWTVLPLAAWRSARATARRGGSSVVDVLGLRAPAPHHALGALILAPTLGHLSMWLLRVQSEVLPLPGGSAQAEALAQQFAALGLPLLLFLTAFTPAVCEEVFFRGALLGGLRRDLSRRASLGWQALIFGVAHASIYRLLPTMWIGLVLGAIRLRTASLWPCVLLHLAYNAWVLTSGSERPAWLDASWLGWVGLWGAVLLALPARPRQDYGARHLPPE